MQTAHTRLSEAQIAQYNKEGYTIFADQVFPQPKFDALKAHFEGMIANLPPEFRPENLDVPHFADPKLFEWLFADEVLNLIEPLIGPDIALWSSHFICKPKGDGRRVPWHEDSYYWRSALEPMEVVTVWLAIDPSTRLNGCMKVIPGTQGNGFSTYEDCDTSKNIFGIEIVKEQRYEERQVLVELQPGQASVHDARIIHGSEPNTSTIRRCGYTMRYMSTRVKFNQDKYSHHQIYLARGRDLAGNTYADPSKSAKDLAYMRAKHNRGGH